jgi:large conductance mechanosensitive channel
MKLVDEFKAFAMKGNVVDMAVGIIIGAAFGRIVSSLVSDIIMPPLGLLIGGVNFTDLKLDINLNPVKEVFWNYGNFIQLCFDFLIVAIAVFFVIKAINAARKKEDTVPAAPPAPPAPTKEETLLSEIRDLLKK